MPNSFLPMLLLAGVFITAIESKLKQDLVLELGGVLCAAVSPLLGMEPTASGMIG